MRSYQAQRQTGKGHISIVNIVIKKYKKLIFVAVIIFSFIQCHMFGFRICAIYELANHVEKEKECSLMDVRFIVLLRQRSITKHSHVEELQKKNNYVETADNHTPENAHVQIN